MSRRLLILSIVADMLLGGAERGRIVVVTFSGVHVYERALEGIRSRIADIQVFDARDQVHLREDFAKERPALAIAIGSEAAKVLERSAAFEGPIVKTLVFEAEIGPGEKARAAITIDLPPAALLDQLKRYFPGKINLGILRGPSQTEAWLRAFEQAARQAGISLVVLSCQDARGVVDTFLQFKGKADFVWCPPNTQLYTSATLKPLLIASITSHLPIIGFSEQFVEAGALFGGGPDFIDVGEQTASAALGILRKEVVADRLPARNFRFVYNQNIARLLGVKASGIDRASELRVIR